jgi:hypothetical protein
MRNDYTKIMLPLLLMGLLDNDNPDIIRTSKPEPKMYTCKQCGILFKPESENKKTWCSAKCYLEAKSLTTT